MPEDFSLPEGWRILTAYEEKDTGLLSVVNATDSTLYLCTVHTKAGRPIAATGKTPKEAIANARKRAEATEAEAPTDARS